MCRLLQRELIRVTDGGLNELKVVLVAMQQWGEAHVPRGRTGSVLPVTRNGHERVRATLVDADGVILGHEDVQFVRVT